MFTVGTVGVCACGRVCMPFSVSANVVPLRMEHGTVILSRALLISPTGRVQSKNERSSSIASFTATAIFATAAVRTLNTCNI